MKHFLNFYRQNSHLQLCKSLPSITLIALLFFSLQQAIEYPLLSNKLFNLGDTYQNILASIEIKESITHFQFQKLIDLSYTNRDFKGHSLALVFLPFLFLFPHFFDAHLAAVIFFNLVAKTGIFLILYRLSKSFFPSVLAAAFLTSFNIFQLIFTQYDTQMVCCASLLLLIGFEANRNPIFSSIAPFSVFLGFMALSSRPLEAAIFYISFLICYGINRSIFFHCLYVFLLSAIWWIPGVSQYLSFGINLPSNPIYLKHFTNWIFYFLTILMIATLTVSRNARHALKSRLFVWFVLFSACTNTFYFFHGTANAHHLAIAGLIIHLAAIAIIFSAHNKITTGVLSSFLILFLLLTVFPLIPRKVLLLFPDDGYQKIFLNHVTNVYDEISKKHVEAIFISLRDSDNSYEPLIINFMYALKIVDIEKGRKLNIILPPYRNLESFKSCNPESDSFLLIEFEPIYESAEERKTDLHPNPLDMNEYYGPSETPEVQYEILHVPKSLRPFRITLKSFHCLKNKI